MENDSATIVRAVTLEPRHVNTGNTKHYVGGKLVSRPAQLIIVRLGSGYNLVHLDLTGQELTDTFHETIDDAVAQAAYEFHVEATDWTETNAPY